NEKQGYELAGFVWFQGFNDLVDGRFYPNRNKPGQFDAYSELLATFIRDVRKDLSAPEMRFVIGVLGVDGEKKNGIFRQAMAAPAAMPEFKGNVVAVETAPFWDDPMEAAQLKDRTFSEIMNTAHALNKDGSMVKASQWHKGWKPIAKLAPQNQVWRYTSFDPQQKKDRLVESTKRRFRDVTLPTGLKQWAMPDFDDSPFKQGKAPIGKGVWKHSGITVNKPGSTWGDGEFLLMRTTFDVAKLDYASYRLSILARQGFHVYLNGHKIHTYVWWQDKPFYRSILLKDAETKHLKKGTNVLAVYTNDMVDKGSTARYGAIDLWIEGITKPDKIRLDKALEKLFPLQEREILKGASNGGYHYLGSAKIMGQIGKAFAEAMVAK
ncbi:MAG: sialate O-acetylesterase, partial [Planctomycetales bacterium]